MTLQASRAALPPGPTGMPLAIALLLLTGLLCCSLIDHTLADAANGNANGIRVGFEAPAGTALFPA